VIKMSRTGQWMLGCLALSLVGLTIGGTALTILGMAIASQNVNFTVAIPQDERLESEISKTWQAPPTGVGADRLFPSTVRELSLVSTAEAEPIRELAMNRTGLQASYSAGKNTVRVHAYPVAPAEQGGLIVAAQNAIGSGQYQMTTSRRGGDSRTDRLVYSVSSPRTYGQLWASQGWLFVFMTEDSSVDLDEFRHEYLQLIVEPAR